MQQFRPDIDRAERSDRRAGSDSVQHANCPAKSYYFPATREAGLVQIANALMELGGGIQLSGLRSDHGLTGD